MRETSSQASSNYSRPFAENGSSTRRSEVRRNATPAGAAFFFAGGFFVLATTNSEAGELLFLVRGIIAQPEIDALKKQDAVAAVWADGPIAPFSP